METLANPSRRRLFKGRTKTQQYLRLPWIINEAVFTAKCTQCQDCLNACETNIIVRDEQGFPKVDFTQGECTFCNKCQQVCEQPLFIDRLLEENKKIKPWPTDLSISNKCLAKAEIFCQSCRDVCESNAIKFSYIKAGKISSIPQPEIVENDCTQCGACITSCPQDALHFDISTNR